MAAFKILTKGKWSWIALLFIASIGGSWWSGYSTGKSAERTMNELRVAEIREQSRLRQEALADELEEARSERRIVYRERVRYVDRVIDDCADVSVPDGVYQSLPR